MFAPAAIKEPIVSKEIRPQSPVIPRVYEYDVETKAGDEITVQR